MAAILFFSMSLIHGSPAPPKKVYTAKHINPHPPRIDGKLNDPVWVNAPWEGDFIQRKPLEGEAPSQKTAFKIVYDQSNIYIAIRSYDTEPTKIVRRMARRDNLEGDWVKVDIDSYHDLRTAFSFAVNAEGVKFDEVISENGGSNDSTWDPIWYVDTSVDDKGWVAEMRIPLSQLRYAGTDEQTWGLQITRRLFRKEESSNWQFIPRDAGGWVHAFGELQGIRGIKHKRQVEIIPYAVGKLQRFEKEDGNPFATGRSQSALGGLDGKIGITSDLTLNFTINPDFGQVEADPSEVNLSAFESYFREKRPFFIEGRNILNFQIMGGDGGFSRDNLFYSRRIGRTPHYYPDTDDDEYVDFPDNTTILGAFKLTGKTKSGLSIGIMESITASETAEIDLFGNRRLMTAEPATNYFLMRVQKDYNKGNTVIGGMLTATNRFLKESDVHLDYLHRSAYTGGFDLSHRWKNKTYYVNFNTVFSHVRGSKEAILETQESSRHYYQRPDATHLTLDPNRTSLSGYGGTISAGKSGNGHFRYSGGVTWRSPGLELNDIGYLRSADRIMQWTWANYRVWKPVAIFKSYSINFNQWQGWDFGNTPIFSGGNVSFSAQFKNYWNIGHGFNFDGKELSSTSLRGGPAMRHEGGWGTWTNIRSDSRKPLRFYFGRANFKGNKGEYDYKDYWMGVTYRPSSRLSIAVHPDFGINKRQLQYVDTLEVDGDNPERYIFATLDQKIISITVRLNYSVSPDLSIQFYGQPFISSGKYTDYKHITHPRAVNPTDRFHLFSPAELSYDNDDQVYFVDENLDGINDYSFDQPSFNFFQFRSNLVVRWEYVPGSTVYLVWSQGRTGYETTFGDFSFGRDFRDLFQVKPHNIFLVKFTYRFNL